MLELEHDGAYHIGILNETGQLVSESLLQVRSGKGSIDFSGQATGLWFLRLQDESNQQLVMMRIVKM